MESKNVMTSPEYIGDQEAEQLLPRMLMSCSGFVLQEGRMYFLLLLYVVIYLYTKVYNAKEVISSVMSKNCTPGWEQLKFVH